MPNLPIYTLGDNDQPTECPKCGARTEFTEIHDEKETQVHLCLGCEYEFILEAKGT